MKLSNIVSKPLIVASLLAVSLASAAVANPAKKNPVSGQDIAKIYSGKTWLWSKGGSYWAKDSSFQAVWEDSVGLGKWYATNKGDLCYEATWYSGGSNEGKQIKRCWRHVTDSKGALWKQDPRDKKWYKATTEVSERIKSGNKIKRDVRATRKKNGV